MIKKFFTKRIFRGIYLNKFSIKYWVIIGSCIIGTISIVYTQILVTKLKEREKDAIDLYAKAIEYTAKELDNTNLAFIRQEIVLSNHSIPVILADEKGNIVTHVNIFEEGEPEQKEQLEKELRTMKAQNPPIIIQLKDQYGVVYATQHVYYKNSFLLTQLNYYPYVQLFVISVFATLAYFAFNYSKKAEQNKLWVGLAKETAHQLGTPLSSLMAWLEYFKQHVKLENALLITELGNDIQRLEMITNRFSNIGSKPKLNRENVNEIVFNVIHYLTSRISKKVTIQVTSVTKITHAFINRALFEWVIENLCKNAVDAMGGKGHIRINIIQANDNKVFIDISDTGKGIAKNSLRKIFLPGYTTKLRGWGLGLALVKRIVEDYHQGKIFVKTSRQGIGTTFRIVLLDKQPFKAKEFPKNS